MKKVSEPGEVESAEQPPQRCGERTTRQLFGLGKIHCPHVSAGVAYVASLEFRSVGLIQSTLECLYFIF